MTRFVAFLTILLFAHALSAPASTYGTASSTNGSIALGVVNGGSYGPNAFNIQGEPTTTEKSIAQHTTSNGEFSNRVSSITCKAVKTFATAFIQDATVTCGGDATN